MHSLFLKNQTPSVGRWRSQRPTLDAVISASNVLNLLHTIFERRFRFGCRFPHFVAFGTCLDTHACCRTPVSEFTPCIARFPVVFRLGLVFHHMSLFALHGFLWRFDFLPASHLGQWCLLSGVLMNQGSPGSEHWQRCWAHRLHV